MPAFETSNRIAARHWHGIPPLLSSLFVNLSAVMSSVVLIRLIKPQSKPLFFHIWYVAYISSGRSRLINQASSFSTSFRCICNEISKKIILLANETADSKNPPHSAISLKIYHEKDEAPLSSNPPAGQPHATQHNTFLIFLLSSVGGFLRNRMLQYSYKS